jgi:hypothetical protein
MPTVALWMLGILWQIARTAQSKQKFSKKNKKSLTNQIPDVIIKAQRKKRR